MRLLLYETRGVFLLVLLFHGTGPFGEMCFL
jgi:hypothetical protein